VVQGTRVSSEFPGTARRRRISSCTTSCCSWWSTRRAAGCSSPGRQRPVRYQSHLARVYRPSHGKEGSHSAPLCALRFGFARRTLSGASLPHACQRRPSGPGMRFRIHLRTGQKGSRDFGAAAQRLTPPHGRTCAARAGRGPLGSLSRVPSALQVREGARIYGGAAYSTCCARASPAAVRVLFGRHAQPDTHARTHARTHMPMPTRMQARRAWARRTARARDAPTRTLHEQASAIMRGHTRTLAR
jgi:hypothetical protein